MSSGHSILRGAISCAVLLLFFMVQPSYAAGSGTVKGRVVDAATGEALPGAIVVVMNTSIGASTDLDGGFVLRSVPAGTTTLKASYVGYDPITREVTVTENATLEQEFRLTPHAIVGKEVVITAQARGQQAAINQQLSSDKIVNVVSEARIQELPDFNAAQAISRLPGISTLQSSGEANKIVIRGLAPQYNQVTIAGVGLASTGSAQIGVASQSGTDPSDFQSISNDRSVDLSMISPYMIKNIAVYKALTPDLNANAIGGVVDMELREAPPEFHTDLLWQSGYTAKTNKYGNYRAVGSASKRFFDDKLGIYALGNIESYDRNADNMNADYFVTDSRHVGTDPSLPGYGYLPVRVRNVSLDRHVETRDRYGANLILDYRLPSGSIRLINMASRLSSNYGDYKTIFNYQSNDLGFEYRGGENKIDVAVNNLNFTNDFGFMSVDLTAANNYSRNSLPAAPDFQFTKTRGVGTSTDNTVPEYLTYLVGFTSADTSDTFLNTLGLYSSDYKEIDQAYKGNFKIPLSVGEHLTGFFKFGGEYRYNYHHNEQTTPYGSAAGTSTIQNLMNAGIRANFPGVVYNAGVSRFPATSFGWLENAIFLDNRFGKLFWTPSVDLLSRVTNYIAATPQFSSDSSTAVQPGGWFDGLFQTRANTYKYIEKYYAGYLMSELDYDKLMIVGGVRYEKQNGLYEAWNLKDGRDTKTQTAYMVTSYPKNEFWLPMVQARYNLTDWSDIRYAYTQTLARPDYHQLSPHFTISYGRNAVRAGNPYLTPAHAYNHDLIFTVHSNEIGLLSVGGFYKTIKNFTYSTNYALYNIAPAGFHTLGEYNIAGFSPMTGATLYTYINSPYLAYVKGIECDFQTRFWYLPAPFNGVVLGINYTHIKSEATYPWLDSRTDYTQRPPVTEVFDSTRTGRLINQPNDIMNAYLGYDYEGFSARLSFLFQGNSVSYVGNFTEQDGFTKDYVRMDASVRQVLPWQGIEVYLDLNNLNSRSNISAQQSIGGFTNQQNYGFTGSLGVRYRL
jgi:TonB-dependent receptor